MIGRERPTGSETVTVKDSSGEKVAPLAGWVITTLWARERTGRARKRVKLRNFMLITCLKKLGRVESIGVLIRKKLPFIRWRASAFHHLRPGVQQRA